jgi:sugar/nucleoside kinase (ribokinase family)
MDFGHGLVDEDIVYLFDGVEFLAVTTQSNAANWGFNLISKYKDANPTYVCIDEQEARLDTGIQYCEAAELLAHLPMALYRTITRGRHGAISADYKHTHIRVPAFIESGYDTMGAGDAFLAVAAPLLAAGLDLEIATFVGNVAGGLKTAIRGHSSYVGRNDLIQNIQWLLK